MDEHQNLFTAPLYTRFLAFIIDAIVAFFPAFVVMLLVLETPVSHHLLAPALYAAPLEGTFTLYELPLEVNQVLNDSIAGTASYAATELRNVSLVSTFLRMLAVFVILFYLFYDTVATILFDGVTVGKYCMGIQTVYVRDGNPTVGILLRQILGKILLNSLGLFVVSIISMIVTPKHYAIHDLIGGTRVVYMTSQKQKFSFDRLFENMRHREEDEDSAGEDTDGENEPDGESISAVESDVDGETASLPDSGTAATADAGFESDAGGETEPEN